MLVLIRQLPMSSRMHAKRIEADPTMRWGASEYLLAGLRDDIRLLLTLGLYKDVKAKAPKVDPIPRPDDVQRERARQIEARKEYEAAARARFDAMFGSEDNTPEEQSWPTGQVESTPDRPTSI